MQKMNSHGAILYSEVIKKGVTKKSHENVNKAESIKGSHSDSGGGSNRRSSSNHLEMLGCSIR